MTKVALLILATSKNRDNWLSIKDTYLFNNTLKTFLQTMDIENEYLFLIGIDKNDRIFDNTTNQREITRFSKVFKNISFKFIIMDNIKKGHVTIMWNKLFDIAYNDNYEYFYQCGDDIIFTTKGWINDSIITLKKHNDIGLTGPINNNNRIMTQAFISRKHYDIFGWLFPEEIINWGCDDWYNILYSPNYIYPLTKHLAANIGGTPRYDINDNKNFMGNTQLDFMKNTNILRNNVKNIAEIHKIILLNYIKKSQII